MSAPATLIIGPEQVLRDQARSQVLAALDIEDRHIVEINTESAAADLRAACEPTLFGSDVVVIVTGLESPDDAGAEDEVQGCLDADDAGGEEGGTDRVDPHDLPARVTLRAGKAGQGDFGTNLVIRPECFRHRGHGCGTHARCVAPKAACATSLDSIPDAATDSFRRSLGIFMENDQNGA